VSASSILRSERALLCDALERGGADAPTLCDGWTTADLAAHLVVREHRPDALPGIVAGGPFARHTTALMEAAKRKGYDSMIATLRSGPPLLFRTGPGAFANVMENWIHHEDVRRANGEGPRPLDPELDAFLWRSLGLTGFLAGRKVQPFGLELDAGDGRRRAARREPAALLRGAPSELALYLSGRTAAAQVELTGPADAQRAVQDASFGL
jgi:uncharacterized protein (TIGR03085 family)